MKRINNSVFWNLRLGFFISFYLLSTINVQSQYYPESFYQTTSIDSINENTLFFSVENSNFLKNNEYFNEIIEGYTLIGYFINPKLVYYPSPKAKLEVGAHLLKYSGLDEFTKILPTLTFHYKASRSVDIVIGTLYGTANHEMIEPLFRHEYFYTDHTENGLQFLFDTKIYKGDIWINWQQFIFKGDDKQEIFTLGLSNKLFLNGRNKKHSFSVPFQVIFVHQGGQINSTSEKLITINNSAAGLNYTLTPQSGFIKSASFESLFAGYNDMSTEHQFPYIQGYGVYSSATVRAWGFNARVGHWYSDHYITKRGHPVFASISTSTDGYFEQKRALITCRLLYEKTVLDGLSLGAGFETFSDLYNYTADYWYMFYINFNRDFFIKKFK